MRALRSMVSATLVFSSTLVVSSTSGSEQTQAGATRTPLVSDPSAGALARFDINHNGVLDPDEREKLRQDILSRLRPLKERVLGQHDLNKNGVLDPEEQLMMTQERQSRVANRGKALAKYDSNMNGALDVEEKATMRAEQKAWLQARKTQALEIYDKNRNGALDPEEMSVIHELARVKREELRKYDTNQDGMVDDAERAGGSNQQPTPAVGGSVPTTYALHRNYPDPFNPRTTLEFDLPQATVVSLRVYNIAGRFVTALIDKREYPAGRHAVHFDGSSLGSGIYLYRLEAGGYSETRKMVLLK